MIQDLQFVHNPTRVRGRQYRFAVTQNVINIKEQVTYSE